MVTYDDFLQTCYDLAGDNSATALAFIQRIGNVGYRRAVRLFARATEERTKTSTTVSGQQYYQTPIDYTAIRSVNVTVGTQKYPLEEVKSQRAWDDLNRTTNMQNSRPTKYFIRLNIGVGGDEIGVWPTPSTSGYAMTLVYEAVARGVGNAAYTTGTVAVSNGSNAVTGTGTSFTSPMVGRYFLVSGSSGDGNYYRVTAVNSITSISLQNYYEGVTSNGSYGIYELFALPEEAQMIPVYYTMWHYYALRQNKETAAFYKGLHDLELKEAKRNQASKSLDGVVRRGGGLDLSTDYPSFFPASINSSP